MHFSSRLLEFLARDIASHPERLQALDADLVQRLESLVGGVEFDLDAAPSADGGMRAQGRTSAGGR